MMKTVFSEWAAETSEQMHAAFAHYGLYDLFYVNEASSSQRKKIRRSRYTGK